MKASFYFVLWQLAYLPVILLDIPFLNKYGLFSAFIIVIFADLIIRKLFKNQIEYQNIYEAAFLMEMAYNNDYKKYKRQSLLQMTAHLAIFIYLLLFFIALFTSFSDVPLIDYILCGAFVILAGISSSWYIRLYLQVRKSGRVTLDKGLQEFYQVYKDERDTCSYEEMLLPRPKYYQIINAVNTLFAILSIVIGLLTTIILYVYNGELGSEAVFYQLSLSIYGILAIYFGIKDLLSISSNQKYIYHLIMKLMHVKRNNLLGLIVTIIVIIAIIARAISLNDPIGWLCHLLLGGVSLILMGWIYKTTDKSSIDWSRYRDLKRVKNAILIIQIISGLCYILLISHICSDWVMGYTNDFEEKEEDFLIFPIYKWSLFVLPYTTYCLYIFTKGTHNALFHTRVLLLVPFLSLLSFVLYILYFTFKNSPSCSNWLLVAFALLLLLLLAFSLRLILITYGSNAKKVFPKNERKINTLDLFFVFLLYFSGFYIYAVDWSSFDRFIYRQAKMKCLEKSDASINKSNSLAVTFYPKNTTIVDSEGSHNFTSYDCPNMNVTDNGNTVNIAWGGDNVILNESHSNSDTYTATGNTSRGKVTIKAFRSSTSGKIYLVTVVMPNPTSDVLHITINFKP